MAGQKRKKRVVEVQKKVSLERDNRMVYLLCFLAVAILALFFLVRYYDLQETSAVITGDVVCQTSYCSENLDVGDIGCDFSATVRKMDKAMPEARISDVVKVGDLVEGSFTYGLGSSINQSGSNSFTYYYDSSPYGIFLKINGIEISSNLNGEDNYYVGIFNDEPRFCDGNSCPYDTFSVNGYGGRGYDMIMEDKSGNLSTNISRVGSVRLQLDDWNGTALSNTNLPFSFNLSNWNQDWAGLTFTFLGSDGASVNAEVTEISCSGVWACKDSIRVNGADYNLKLAYIDEARVILNINGVNTSMLSKGDVAGVGINYLKIEEILYSMKENSISRVELILAPDQDFYRTGAMILVQNKGGCSCSPNWTAVNGLCKAGDVKEAYYLDYNSCFGATGKPANFTIYCDYDGNGIIGNKSGIEAHEVALDVKIADKVLNLSANYTGIKKVVLEDANESVIEFNWNFATPLNLEEVAIVKQDEDESRGYVLIRGLNVNKTVYVDILDSSSEAVCIEDSDIESISRISSSCRGSNEYLVRCPGRNGSYYCDLEGSQFVVTGVMHSGVKEFVPSSSTGGCTPDWSCTTYSACLSGAQTRVCSDLNSCGDSSGKPVESKACNETTTTTSTSGTCTSKWSCSKWSECVDGTQTKTCTDTKNCGDSSGKPAEERECSAKTADIIKYVLIGVLIIGIIGISYLLYSMLSKKKPSEGSPIVQGAPPQWPQ